MTVSRWREDIAAHDEAFTCLQDLFSPHSFAVTAVKALRDWGQGMLRLSEALVGEIEALERENTGLRERIDALERSAALDSSTSSKPPASDGPKKKSGNRQKRTRSQRGKSDRPSGGQRGHEGVTLKQAENPDHVVDHAPSACKGCGAPLSDDDRHAEPVCRQVFDMPEPQPLEVTEHRAHRCLCAACGAVTTAAFPHGVSAPVQYGPRITAWVTYLLHAQFIPEKRVAEVMSDLFAVRISTATIAAMGRRTARRFESFLDHVAEIIRTQAPVKHLDETGIRINGQTHWLHVLCTPLLTILRLATGRKHIDETLNGIVIHDDLATYFTLEGVRHGACNAHRSRELQALIEIEKEDWATAMHRLLIRANRAARFARKNDRDIPASLLARISQAWDRILEQAIASHEQRPPLQPGKRGRRKRRIGHNLALRLQKHKDGCLRFLTNPQVPFSNNQAEQDFRMSKLRQKISGGFRSMQGAERLRQAAIRHLHRPKTGLECPRNTGPPRSHIADPETALLTSLLGVIRPQPSIHLPSGLGKIRPGQLPHLAQEGGAKHSVREGGSNIPIHAWVIERSSAAAPAPSPSAILNSSTKT